VSFFDMNLARLAAGCLLAFCFVQLVVNLLLTYRGYDAKALYGWCVVRKRWSGGLAVAAWLAIHSANLYLEQQIDRGPFEITRVELVGTWAKDESQFRLNADGTFAHLEPPDVVERNLYWRPVASSDGLEVRDEGGNLTERWRLVRYRGEYRILHHYEASQWGTPADMGFARVSQ